MVLGVEIFEQSHAACLVIIGLQRLYRIFTLQSIGRNISTQYIATLLDQHLQPPVLRSQHFNTAYRNIVGRNMLRAFVCAATCWVLETELVRMPGCNNVART